MINLRIQDFHNIRATIDGQEQKIISLSSDSLSFESPLKIQLGMRVNLELTFEQTKRDFSVEFIDKEGSLKTGIIIKDRDTYQGLIKRHFKPELMGQKLSAIPTSKIKEVPGFTPHWFYEDTENEIYFLIKDEKVCEFQISLDGQILIFDGAGVISGTLWEEINTKFSHSKSDLVQEVDSLDNSAMKDILRFISSCHHIDNAHSKQIIDLIMGKFIKDIRS